MDVIILGGGIVGLTMANLLAHDTDLSITLVEAKAPSLDWDNSTYDLRCSAIARASLNIFKHIQVWDNIVADRVGMYDKMQIWDSSSKETLNFAAADMAEPDLGHIVENRVMQRALRNNLSKFSSVTICSGLAHKLQQIDNGVELYIDDYKYAAKLIIGADGADSWLRAASNISTHGWNYKQSALVATIKSQLPHNKTARQRFSADGPLAFLPLADSNLSSIVWSSSPERIKYLMQLAPNEFCSSLESEFAFKLGALELQGERAYFPLRMLHAKDYIQQRVALIGDAAHVIHPLAGQGMNLGIMDAAVLAEVLQDALLNNIDIGRHSVLRKYERWRKGHNLSMIAIVEAFKQSHTLLTSINMGLFNKAHLAKKCMVRFAMGVTGDIPDSAKYNNLGG